MLDSQQAMPLRARDRRVHEARRHLRERPLREVPRHRLGLQLLEVRRLREGLRRRQQVRLPEVRPALRFRRALQMSRHSYRRAAP